MIFRSEHPRRRRFPTWPTRASILQHAAERADQPVLVDGPSGATLTLGAGRRGGAPGGGRRSPAAVSSRATWSRIYSPNLPEYALAFHGPRRAGGVVTTANPLYTPEELALPAPRHRRHVPGHGPAVAREGARGRPRHARARDLRLRRGRGRDAVRRAPRKRRRRSRRAHRPARGSRRAAVLERHLGPAQGRDAHPPQPRRRDLPGRGPGAASTSDWRTLGILPFFHIYGPSCS